MLLDWGVQSQLASRVASRGWEGNLSQCHLSLAAELHGYWMLVTAHACDCVACCSHHHYSLSTFRVLGANRGLADSQYQNVNVPKNVLHPHLLISSYNQTTFALNNISVCSMQCAVCSMQCAVCSVQCAVLRLLQQGCDTSDHI